MNNTLPLKKNADFRKLYTKGSSMASKYVVFFWLKNRYNYNRAGFVASKKVGKSVIRNKARRLMKESFRTYEKRTKSGYDFIFIARQTIKNATYKDVRKAMDYLLRKSKMMK